jgi:hypothetical protein
MMPWNVKRVCVVDLLFEYMFTKSTDRLINLQHIADKTEGAAWKAVEQASNERDITDFKEAVQVLVKACPELTYPQLEKEFRKRDFNIYLVALVRLAYSKLSPQLANMLLPTRRKIMETHSRP